MNDIFSNLVIRNADHPSPEVLQPRLPSLFEPSTSVDGSPESALDLSLSLSPQPVIRNNVEQPSTLPFDRELTSPGQVSFQEPPASNIKDSSQVVQSAKQLAMESYREMTIPKFASSQQMQSSSGTIHAASSETSFEEIQNDKARSATIMSDVERIPDRAHPNDPHRELVNAGERIVHPRAERVTANKVDRWVEPSRDVPGRVDKSMDVFQPREESNHTEQPVVRIHIGRIEVRAITPPPPQPASKPAPAQPRLTLDDYLRQREGRR